MEYFPNEPVYRNGEFIQCGAWHEREATPVSLPPPPATTPYKGQKRKILWQD